MPGYETMTVQDQGAVRLLGLNRPRLRNPADRAGCAEMIRALEEAERSPGVRALVLTGAGEYFSAVGGEGARGAGDAEGAALLNRSIIALRRLSKPVVCALNGPASGGGLGWALACDLAAAAEGARLEAGDGAPLAPQGGAGVLLTRTLGHKRAGAFFLLGRAIDAARALEWGLVNRVVPGHAVLGKALELAEELARGPAQALAATKALLNQAVLGDLEAMLEDERREAVRLADVRAALET